MRLTRFREKEFLGKGQRVIKFFSIPTVVFLTAAAQLSVLILSIKGSFFPETDSFLTIVGTCAQIIAGLYGITMAGYTFFLSRMDALSASDMTLDYVINSIKTRFKFLIWFITYNVLITLFVSITLMYAPAPEDERHEFFYRLFCNEFLLSMIFSVVLILYYSILVIDPNCIEKEARKLKKRLSRQTGAPGDAVAFFIKYDRLADYCSELLPNNVLSRIRENKGSRFEYTLELLEEQRILPIQLIRDLKRLHRYYECVLNASPISVTKEMCDLADKVLEWFDDTEKH